MNHEPLFYVGIVIGLLLSFFLWWVVSFAVEWWYARRRQHLRGEWLDRIALERGLERRPGETDKQLRERLVRVWR